MIAIKVGENFARIDDEDMTALLDILTDAEHAAEPASPPVIEKAAEWFIALVVEIGYTLLFKDWIEGRREAIIDHFRAKRAKQEPEEAAAQPLPKGIKIYDGNGDVLAVIPLQDEDEGLTDEPRIILP